MYVNPISNCPHIEECLKIPIEEFKQKDSKSLFFNKSIHFKQM